MTQLFKTVEEARAFQPKVGDIVYREQPDPFAPEPERKNGFRVGRPQCSVGVKIVRMTKTRITTEDNRQYVIHTDRKRWYHSEARDDGYLWSASAYGRYSSGRVYNAPLHETVYLYSDMVKRIADESNAKVEAAKVALRKRIDEEGLSVVLYDTFQKNDSFNRRTALRELRNLLTDEEKEKFTDVLTDVAFGLADTLSIATGRLERIAEQAASMVASLNRS
ncbi:MAG TPA: hypothetical protein VIU40_04730 [Geobacteraceae bacterium]